MIENSILEVQICAERQNNVEGRSAPYFTFGPDPAFMRINNMSCDRQSQTGTLLPLSLLIAALIEVFENILDLSSRNTRAIIGDP